MTTPARTPTDSEERVRELWRANRNDLQNAIRLAGYARLPQNSKCEGDAETGQAAFERLDAALGEARGTASASEQGIAVDLALGAATHPGASGDAPPAPPAPDLLRENARLRSALEGSVIAGAGGSLSVSQWKALAELATEEVKRENARLREEVAEWKHAADVRGMSYERIAAQLTRARAAHLENAELLAKAQGRAAKMETAIRWALGEQPSGDGRWFASAKFGWREGLRVPPFWWRTFLRLFSEVDFGLADRKGIAPQAPSDIAAAAAAPAKEGKKP